MKGLRIGLIVFAAAVFTFGLSGMAFAFHSGGVAECMGCHNIHDGKSASSLLIATDISSTCTNAIATEQIPPGSYHIASYTNVNNGRPDADDPGRGFRVAVEELLLVAAPNHHD